MKINILSGLGDTCSDNKWQRKKIEMESYQQQRITAAVLSLNGYEINKDKLCVEELIETLRLNEIDWIEIAWMDGGGG